MQIARHALVTLVIVAAALPAAGAEADSSTIRSLPGFASTGSKSAPRKVVSSSPKRKSPTVLTQASNRTRRWATSTKHFFMPWTKSTTKRSGDTQSGFASATRGADKPGFFKSMFQPDPPPPPRTISEWMSLKQVHP